MRASPRHPAVRSGKVVSTRATGEDHAAVRPGQSAVWLEQVAVWLERAAFFILLLVVGVRPLLSETYESSEGLFADYVRGTGVTTPATTAGFDSVIWLAALAATAAVLMTRKRAASPFCWRWTGLEIGWLVMVGAAAVSTIVAASNKRLAVNASVDWLSSLVLVMTLANLCRNRLRIALVLGVIVAAGAASATKSVMQVTSEYRLTREDYEQNKAKIWGEVPLDDPRVLLYERRLKGNTASGFLSHSNAEGSLLLVCGFAAIAAGGLTSVRWARWALYAGGGAILAAIILTGSKGAVLAAGACVVLLLALRLMAPVLRRHWRAALGLAWGAVLLGAVGITALGLARGGLPGSSLGFRWNYWQVTAGIVKDHPWAGVGALNFDHAYLQRKPIDFPEEIRDPHDFVLAILSQWGVAGLVGLTLALVGASITAARRWAAGASETAPDPLPPESVRQELWRWIPAVVVGFLLLRIWLMRGLMATVSGRATIFVDLVQYGLVWAACFTAVAALAATPARKGDTTWWLAVLCGVAAFLLHNTIEFSLFVPGAAAVFAGLGGVLLAEGLRGTREGGAEGRGDTGTRGRGDAGMRGCGDKETRRWALGEAALVPVAAAGLLVVLVLVFIPVSVSAAALAEARAMPLPAACQYYDDAASLDPLDPVPLSEKAERLIKGANLADVETAIASLDKAIGRDPLQIDYYRRRAQLYDLLYGLNRDAPELQEALKSARRAMELYPQSPDEHVTLAIILSHAAMATGSAEWAEKARAEYEKALALDTARPGTDEVRKWSERKRAEIEAAVDALAKPTATQSSGHAASITSPFSGVQVHTDGKVRSFTSARPRGLMTFANGMRQSVCRRMA